MTSTAKGLAALTCGVTAAALLAACKPGAEEASAQDAPPPLAALPLTNVSAAQAHPGPVAVDLPYARPARIGPTLDPGDGYAYLDRAYFLNDAFGEAPPDYAFDYDEETPWAWQTDDGFIRVVEALPYGDRYYYYEPGDDYPFLIRDPDYAYAYADGRLVALYDSGGALLPPEDLMLHAPIAGRELARGRAMFRHAGARQPVALQAWSGRRGQVASELGQWQKQQTQQTGWRRYHDTHRKQEQAHWAPERFRREAEAARVLQQVHDPDGARHALREARRAQDVARKAHVQIAVLPHNRAVAGGPQGRLAANAPGPGRVPGSDRGMRIEARPALAPADVGRPDPGRLAMAVRRPGLRAQHEVRGPERAFDAPVGRHMRAIQPFRPGRQEQAAAAPPELHARGGEGHAFRPEQPPHLQIPPALHEPPRHAPAPHFGGDQGGGGGGGHPDMGGDHGGHGGPPPQEGHGHGH